MATRALTSEAAKPIEPPKVTVNRTVPRVTRPSAELSFSATPTAAEIQQARVLYQPLIPTGETTDAQNVELVAAIREFLARTKEPRWEPFNAFLSRHPFSPWRAALMANIGVLLQRGGYYSRALAAWDDAWELSRGIEKGPARDIADFAVGEWLETAIKFGKVEDVQARLAEVRTRTMSGTGATKAAQAAEGLRVLTSMHSVAVFSAAEALKHVLVATRGEAAGGALPLEGYHAPNSGTTLAALSDLARKVGFRPRALFRPQGAPLPVPSVIHLRVNHYTAVIGRERGGYVLRDPALGGTIWVSDAALEDEASGYVLAVTDQELKGWRTVTPGESNQVVGHCAPGAPGEDPCDCHGNSNGMAIYKFHPVKASLQLMDTPVSYSPPRGPAVPFELRYDSRDQRQPQTFAYGHVGPRWSFEWLSYVTDNLSSVFPPYTWKVVYLRGESTESYGAMDLSPYHWRSRAQLVQVSADPVRYERRLPDGTIELFELPDRPSTAPGRRVFLTSLVDPQGQTLVFTYDAQFRLVALTDAVGQVTTLSYEHATDPLKLTKITDPFGRFATLSYNDAGQLAAITDVIGITSSFTYDASDFITSLTTPYGTTTFQQDTPTPGPHNRSIQATDPLGGTERLEYRISTTALPATAPAAQVPTGFAAYNADLNKYVTLYWSKLAMARAPLDVSSANVTRWLVGGDLNYGFLYSRNIPHSVKQPLENRVWFRYPGQGASQNDSVGVGRAPTHTARVLDDGSTQLSQATFNDHGMALSRTDPLGRRTSYAYAVNGIDLLEARQTTGTLNDLLGSSGSYTAEHLPQTVTNAAGQVTTSTYNAAGQVLTRSNALNETTTFAYDAGGLLAAVIGPVAGATTTYTYDGYGRIRTATGPDGFTVTHDYDPLDRLGRTTFPDGTYDETVYGGLDAIGRRDRMGRWTHYMFDALRRATSTRDPLGRTVQQQWCSCGTLDAVIDAAGKRTSWQRDVQGRATLLVRPDGTTEAVYVYDASGRLEAVTDAKQQVKSYLYAADDALLSIAFANAEVPTPSVTYAYDAIYGRLTAMTDGTGSTTYGYGPLGAPGALQVTTIDGPLANDTITYAYDELERPVERRINGSANTLTWSYDALGRIIAESNALGTFTYQVLGCYSAVCLHDISQWAEQRLLV